MARSIAARDRAARAALLDQSALLRAYVRGITDEQAARNAVSPESSVVTLVEHLVLVHERLVASLQRPSTERPQSAYEYGQRHHGATPEPEAEQTLAVTGETTVAVLVQRMDDAGVALDTALAADLPAVVLSDDGPLSTPDLLAGAVIELVVHADDLTRSLPEPAPMARQALALAVRTLAEYLVARAPGRTVEVRIPPFVAVQAIPGPRHTRGTPPNVVETDPLTWLRLATGRLAWNQAVDDGAVRASGQRGNLGDHLPLL